MTAEILLFGPSILFFSVLASLSDFRERKIPNRIIVRMLAVAFILNLFYFFRNPSQLLVFLMFVLSSSVVSFILWLVGFWKPGDVKFYSALTCFFHPRNTSAFFAPLLIFFALTFVFTLAEGLMKKKVKFSPNFSLGMLLPVALSKLFSLQAISIAAPIVLFFLGKYLRSFGAPILGLSILSIIFFPAESLKVLLFVLAMFLVSSLKFEGWLPSAPFISASFIYLLA